MKDKAESHLRNNERSVDVPVYNLKKLGCVNDKQNRTETGSLRNTILQGKTVRESPIDRDALTSVP